MIIRTCLFISLFFFILFSSSATSPKSYLPLEVYSALPNKSLFRISPDGNKMAYRLIDGEKDLFLVVDLTKRKVIRGFDVKAINPENAYFISNEKLIFTVERRSRIRGFIGRYDVSTAFVYDIKSNKVSQLLTPGKGIYKGQTQLGNIIGISDDVKWAYMTAYTLRGRGGVPKNSVMKVNLDKPYKTPRIYVEGESNIIDYFLDKDNQVIAREKYDEEQNLHTVEVPDGDYWRVIFQEEVPYITRSFSGVTADESSLVMLVNQQGQQEDYFLLSLDNGKISHADFVKSDKHIELALTDINRTVYGVKYAGFKPSYSFFDSKLSKQFKDIQQELPSSNITLQDFTSDRSKLIVFAEWDGLAGDFLSYENGKLSHVAKLRENMSWRDINGVVEFKFTARDGLVIPTLLTIPNSAMDSKKKLPAIVLPHGGPESYDKKTFHWLAQYFASRGFLVIQPQFRGSSGFGAEHTLKGRGEWGARMQDDISDAIDKLIDMGEVDPENVCIVGSSYGGYAALAGAIFTPELYKCAIAISGISDIAKMLEDEEDDHGKDSSVLSYWQDVITSNNVNEEQLKARSPIYHVENTNVPILLIHGTDDKVVSFEQSEQMFKVLEKANKPVELVPLRMEGHYLLKQTNRLKMLQAIDKFIHKYIQI